MSTQAISVKLDNLVLNVDSINQSRKKAYQVRDKLGIPYEPHGGRLTEGSVESNLWIGYEYLRLMRFTKPSNWGSEWSHRYQSGQRGLICLMIDADDIEILYRRMHKNGLTKPVEHKYRWFYGMFPVESPWVDCYFPFFEGVPFQIGIQQKHQDSKKQFRSHMEPNSRLSGITGIRCVEIHGPFTSQDMRRITAWFDSVGSCSDGVLSWVFEDGKQHVTFVQAKDFKVVVYLYRDQEIPVECKREPVKIENVVLRI